MTRLAPHYPVVVIGAGQAGLSVAYFLRRFALRPGVDFVVLDRGPRAGGAWQFRWDALKIGSAHRITDLPGMAETGLSFESADRTVPAREVVAAYYASYEQHFALNVVRPAEVISVSNSGTDLRVEASLGMMTTHIIVNATGTWGAPFIPYYSGQASFRGRQVHTSSYSSAEDFRGQSVVVVGGGTSAIGFLHELDGVASHVEWASRRPIDWRPDTAGADLLEAVSEQEQAAREGRALPSIVHGTGVVLNRRNAEGRARGLLVERPMFTAIESDGVRWPDGTFTQADAILWATGFRPELRHLAPLRLRSGEGGVRVEAGMTWRDPRVFLAGYGPFASTIGAGRSGRLIARKVIAAL